MSEQQTVTMPEGVEVKPSPHGGRNLVWVDGEAMAMPGDGLSSEDLEVFASRVRRTAIIEDAERRAVEALHRGTVSEEAAEHAAAFIRDFVLEVLVDRGFVTDGEQLGNAAWRIANGLSPLTIKFAHALYLESYIGASSQQSQEVEGGLLADALDRVIPIVEAYRART